MTDLIVIGVVILSVCGALEGNLFLGLLAIYSAAYLLNDLLPIIFQERKTMWNVFAIFVFVAGGVTVWFTRDWFVQKVTGAENFAKALEAKAAALKAALR